MGGEVEFCFAVKGSFEFPHPILLGRVNYPQFELFAQVAGFFMGEMTR